MELKWVITPPGEPNIETLSEEDEKEIFEKMKPSCDTELECWNSLHHEKQYEDTWSVTEDPEICIKLTSETNECTKKILIPGCGSKTNLQKYLVENFKNVVEIYCIDYSQPALDQEQSKYKDKKIFYKKEDSTRMTFEENCFDNIIISNAVLSAYDLVNRRIIRECYRVLKPGGKLCGLFPSIFVSFEGAILDSRFSHLFSDGTADVVKNSFYESTQSMRQIHYTPLRLKRIFEEAGFKRKRFEIYFFDNKYFSKENERIYGIPKDSELCIWEIFVVLEK